MGRAVIRRFSCWLVFALLVLVASPGYPQALPPVFDPALRSGEVPPPMREQFEPQKMPPRDVLPPAPEPPREQPGLKFPEPRVFVKEVQVTGSTVFSEDQLKEVTEPYENRVLTTEDLEQLRVALTMLYVKKGYLTSGAIIPDQLVSEGIVRIRIIEGELARIDVEGTEWFRPHYLEGRVRLGARKPLQLAPLQERLQLLQQDARIARLNAELRPGDERGLSVLNLRVQERRPYHAWLEFNNFQTPVVGAERGLMTVAHENVTGNGDPFSLTFGGSSGVFPLVNAVYSIPFTPYDTSFAATYRRNDFVVVEAPFDSLNINSQTEIIGFSLRQPIYQTVNEILAVAIIGEHLYNKTFIFDDTPFDFVAGAQNGVSNISALRFFQEYVYRTQTRVLAARSRFSVGIDALGATVNSGDLADAQFFSWLGRVQGVQRFERFGGMQLLGRMDLQLANDRLFPLEQIPVGGRFTVRGYRQNQLIRDNAFLASIEARFPVLVAPRHGGIVELAPFLDYGKAWNTKVSTPSPSFLASVGLGVRWNILPEDRARFELYWGVPLNHVNTPGGNLQDYGLHLQLVIRVF